MAITNVLEAYGSNLIGSHSSGTNITNMTQLSDVDISSPTDGQILQYNGTSQKWENNGLILTATLTAGSTSVTFTNSGITTDAMIDIYTTVYGLNPTNVTVSTGSAVLTFEAQQSDVSVRIKVV